MADNTITKDGMQGLGSTFYICGNHTKCGSLGPTVWNISELWVLEYGAKINLNSIQRIKNSMYTFICIKLKLIKIDLKFY